MRLKNIEKILENLNKKNINLNEKEINSQYILFAKKIQNQSIRSPYYLKFKYTKNYMKSIKNVFTGVLAVAVVFYAGSFSVDRVQALNLANEIKLSISENKVLPEFMAQAKSLSLSVSEVLLNGKVISKSEFDAFTKPNFLEVSENVSNQNGVVASGGAFDLNGNVVEVTQNDIKLAQEQIKKDMNSLTKFFKIEKENEVIYIGMDNDNVIKFVGGSVTAK